MAAKKRPSVIDGVLERTEAKLRARGISQARINAAKERLAQSDAIADAKMPTMEQVSKRWLVERQAEVIANEPTDSSARQAATASLMRWQKMLTDKVEVSGGLTLEQLVPKAKKG